MVPPDFARLQEVRGGEVDGLLVEAIETITRMVARAAGGDDPFLLQESTVELAFAVTDSGSISLGVDAGADDVVTHTLRLKLAPAGG